MSGPAALAGFPASGRGGARAAAEPRERAGRAYLRSIRRGERPLDEVLDAITDAEERLTGLRDNPALADQPDRHWVDGWLHRSYLNFWTGTQ